LIIEGKIYIVLTCYITEKCSAWQSGQKTMQANYASALGQSRTW